MLAEFVGKHEEEILSGSHRHGWENDIKMDVYQMTLRVRTEFKDRTTFSSDVPGLIPGPGFV